MDATFWKCAVALLAVACCTAIPAGAQESCTAPDSNGIVTCTIPPGTYSSAVQLAPQPSGNVISVINEGTINVQNNSSYFALQNRVGGRPSPSLTLDSTGSIALQVSSILGTSIPYTALSFISEGDHAGSPGGTAGPVTVTISAPVSLIFTPTSTTSTAYGVLAQTIGGEGNGASPGGAGGLAGAVSVTVSNTTVTLQTPGGLPGAAAFYASQVGGAGGLGGNNSQGGLGGFTDNLTLTLNAATVAASGSDAVVASQVAGPGGNASNGGNSSIAMAGGGGDAGPLTAMVTDATISATNGRGLALVQTAGAGGNGPNENNSADNQWSNAGSGGDTGGISLTFSQSTTGTTITTAGDNAPGVLVQATGGAGGSTYQAGSGLDFDTGAGNGGNGGLASGENGEVLVKSTGTLVISTTGDKSPGIAAIGQGGLGGTAGEVVCSEGCTPGAGGSGGGGGPVEVDLGSGATITTAGENAPAVAALSFGGNGGAAGGANAATGDATGLASGNGGFSPGVAVTLKSGVALTTMGANSPALLVQSVGGQGGGNPTDSGQVTASFGDAIGTAGGIGGSVGGVSVTSGATITTSGSASRGIMVQALSGPGGAGGLASGSESTGGAGGASGTIGDVTLTNEGAIATSGAGAQGILVQSIAGGGGAGGTSTGFFTANGGSATFANANAGNVTITNSSTVSTAGPVAAAIVGQSIGGGGGDGGSGSGIFYNQGGTAGAGGNGAAVTVSLGGSVSTDGVLSHGVLAQSIGGSGGTGGNAVSNGTVATYVVGGSAGAGGQAGTVTVNASGAEVRLSGSGADGILAQSVGGGGGAGGAAYALDVGNSFAYASAIGGAGGNGGNAGTVTVTTANTTISTGRPAAAVPTLPVDAIGILAQSVAGGGGAGGGASAAAVAIGLPSPPESKTVAITVTDSVGGAGGSGGSPNGLVTATLQDGASVLTAGAGSIGVLTQSIGGGGGQGGDSSTFSATIGSAGKYLSPSGGTQTVSLNFSVGAKGGSGGNGGIATLNLGNALGAQPGKTAGIATTGDYADGAVVQSIGGGGGNAGAGSSQMFVTGAGSSVKFSLDLGAQGGTGGLGGSVNVNLYPESTITTLGSGAVGVLAQSIGGGGGNSTGYTINLAGLQTSNVLPNAALQINPTLGLGAAGGIGNSGGDITAVSQGSIATIGDDAPGLLLQSIGGGGGVGGSPGQDAAASGDKTESPIGTLSSTTEGEPGFNSPSMTVGVDGALTLGGSGGAAGDGGTITLTQQGSVTTSGDYAPGVIAQSIGGGGGRGGSALVGTQSNSLKVRVSELEVFENVSLGMNGTGGGGGKGGDVTVSLNGVAIHTGAAASGSSGTGFQSFGVLAQSIGDGSGMAGDGTSGPNGVTLIGAGASGAGGAGGAVLIQQKPIGTTNTIGTTGDYASGIVAQSIGGGGGIYGAGSSAPVTNTFYTGNVDLELGSQAANTAAGDGGSVQIQNPDANITTSGNGAFGVLAQSVGAGGGLAAVGGQATVTQLGAINGASGNGGNVTVDLAFASIVTSGLGADGVVAQSIGGGGGVAALATAGTVPSLTTAPPSQWVRNSTGTGGTVSVSTTGPITVTGDGAFGILAQSVSGGGGLATVAPGTLFAGSTSAGGSVQSAGNVTVTTGAGAIMATGQNGTAIFAQSAASAPSAASGTVKISLGDGGAEGGSGAQGYGVWVVGGNSDNELTIEEGATLSAESGTAINYNGAFGVNVMNDGTLVGSYNLGSGTLTNNSILVVAGPRAPGPYYGEATLQGNLVQTASGEIHTDVDFASARAGRLVVTGDALLGGRIVPTVSTVLPNVNVPVMIIDGTVAGTIQGSHSTLFEYDIHDPPAEITLSARSTGFAPAGFGVRGAAADVAAYLEPVFDTATTPELGTLFANLGTLADAGATGYIDALQQLSPGGVLAFASRARADIMGFGDTMLRCERFIGTSAIITKKGCEWMELSGGIADQNNAGGYPGFTDSTLNYRLGGQAVIAPGWVLGGALGYAHSWLDGDFNTTGDGDGGYAGLSLTCQWQGFEFTGALLGSFSVNSTSRTVSIPGFQGVLSGHPDVDTEAAMLRADYTFGLGHAYIRPSMTVGIVRVHAGAFSENGQQTVGLDFGNSTTVSGVFTPEVEFGLRTDLKGGMTLRSYLTLGASPPTTSKFREPVRLEGAALAAGSYEASIPTDSAAATVGVGVQLISRNDFDVRLAYSGAFSGRVTENSGMLIGTLHF